MSGRPETTQPLRYKPFQGTLANPPAEKIVSKPPQLQSEDRLSPLSARPDRSAVGGQNGVHPPIDHLGRRAIKPLAENAGVC